MNVSDCVIFIAMIILFSSVHYSGHEFTLFQQYGAVAVLSFPLFFVAGATSAVFWVIGEFIFIGLLSI